MKKIFVVVAMLTVLAAFAHAKVGVSVTVYNQDLALVRDVRNMKFEKGVGEVLFKDVASQIDQTSVHFGASGVALLEQNYDYDLVSPEKLLQKYVDQEIEVITENGDAVRGTLLTSSGNNIVIQAPDGSLRTLLSESTREIRYPKLPDGLITRPTLRWLVNAGTSGDKETEVSYLTGGMSWRADYVMVIDESNKADLGAWVTVNNNCGASFMDAKLKLIAGEVHRAQQMLETVYVSAKRDVMADGAAPQFSEKSFFEYHLYTLERPTDLLNNQTKQVSLFPNTSIQTKRIYEYYWQRKQNRVAVTLEFENKENNGLGMPLPAGTVRVFQADTDGSQEFIGEDNIEHTPKDEKVRVMIGEAFDIAVERTQTDYRQVSNRVTEKDIEVKIRNHKKEAVTVVVIDHAWGDWEIRGASIPVRKVSATKFEFDVPAEPDKEVVLKYTIRNG